MIAKTNENIKLKKAESFFDYWHFNEIDIPVQAVSEKIAEKIANKIRLRQICEELPDHCFQLLFIS